MAQRRAQMVERIAESAYSGIGIVVEQMRHAQSVAKATVAKAQFVRGEIEGKMAELKQCAEARASITENVLGFRIE